MISIRFPLSLVILLVTVVLTVSCSATYDIILLSEPIFEQEVAAVSESIFPDEGRFKLVAYDPVEDTQRSRTEFLVLTPGLSRSVRLESDSRLEEVVAAWEEQGTEIVLTVSMQTVRELEDRSSRSMIFFDPAVGWNQVDLLLRQEYESPSKVGVMYDPSIYGNQYEIEQLLPGLFADSSSLPETLIDKDGFNSQARVESALESFSSRGVEVVLIIIGGKGSQALPLLEKHDMLAVIEYGQVLDAYRSVCLASIEIDYAATFRALMEQDASVYPLKQKIIRYR